MNHKDRLIKELREVLEDLAKDSIYMEDSPMRKSFAEIRWERLNANELASLWAILGFLRR